MLILLSPFPFPPSSRPVEEALGHAGKMRSWEKIYFGNWKTQVLIVTTHTVSTGTCLPWDAPNSLLLFLKKIFVYLFGCVGFSLQSIDSLVIVCGLSSCGPWTAGYAGMKPHGLP